ncbi:hypothetical protein PR202_gb27737 [Eleusine coracana subsp. coracana]|uniref:4-hydroxyphenylacetaldehyde oxime monooxygenase n=1 Tax=Eleusine coracana subsp. coracana TaxID=191504 RepID=A0AAV5FUJ8_ELECO|nr:hypothetical protein PR202_gb27737 [Eleusine coracana subsp. coracana]
MTMAHRSQQRYYSNRGNNFMETLNLVAAVPLVFLLVLFLWSSWIWSRGRSRSSTVNLPPGPQRVPVLGNLHQIGALPHRSLWALARRHGPVMMLRLGSVPTLVVSSPEAARAVMKTHDVHCCTRPALQGPRQLTYNFKDVAFAPYGDHVREMRKLFILELLSMRRVQATWDAREAQCHGWHHRHSSFREIYGTEQFKMPFLNMLREAMDMLGSMCAEDFLPSMAGRLIDRLTGLVKRRERIFRRLDAFFDSVIEDHLNLPSSKKVDKENSQSNLVQALVELWLGNGSAMTFTRDHVKAMLFDTFVGGINTTAVTMVWAMSELIRHPRALKSVQDEIRAVVGKKGRVTPDDVPKLKNLKMVVKETLRLHPPLPLLLPRETSKEVNVIGYNVPANTRVIVNAWAIGRDRDIWEDPEKFDPERFMGSAIDYNGANFEFTPFGSGRRICPGMAMAVTNIEFTLGNLLCCFDWELPEGVRKEDISMQETGSLAFHKKTPLILVPRTS